MRPDERRRRRGRGRSRSSESNAKEAPRDLESFRASLPDVEPVRVTEAAAYYYAQPQGWWFETACPMHPEVYGPFPTLDGALFMGERGCTPCGDVNCAARIEGIAPEERSAMASEAGPQIGRPSQCIPERTGIAYPKPDVRFQERTPAVTKDETQAERRDDRRDGRQGERRVEVQAQSPSITMSTTSVESIPKPSGKARVITLKSRSQCSVFQPRRPQSSELQPGRHRPRSSQPRTDQSIGTPPIADSGSGPRKNPRRRSRGRRGPSADRPADKKAS